MDDTTLRLTAEMREKGTDGVSDRGLLILAQDALHDLDVLENKLVAAQRERGEWRGNYEAVSGCQESCEKDLEEAQATIAQQRAVIAAMRGPLSSLWQFVNLGDCPLTKKVVTALTDTAQIAADHDAAVRAEERERIAQWLESMHDYEVAARVRELAAQPEEDMALSEQIDKLSKED